MTRDLVGLLIVNRETEEREDDLFFSHEELDLPGYVETIEKTYDGSPWKTVRVYRTEDT